MVGSFDLGDAGKLASDGWLFMSSYNTERATGKSFFYIPACASMPADLAARIRGADLVFFDGTVSSLYSPELGRLNNFVPLGPNCVSICAAVIVHMSAIIALARLAASER